MTIHRAALLAAATTVVLVVSGCSSAQITAAGGTETTPTTTGSSAAAAPPTVSRSVQPERSAPPVPTAVDPALAGVDRSSIDAVATAVVTAFTTANTATDTGPNDAAARTISLLTADYAAAIITTPPLRSPGARWNTWSAQGVRLTATVEPLADDRPADTTSTATRIYLVTQTPTTRTGQVLDPVVTVAYMGLRRDTSGWAVAQVEQR
ncbi:hypothetical protein RHODO2019_17960 (plasmid) [Rhodococcus antarcticus]|uniref:Mce-associated membrane protein n=1 Tax=Rhodococcus antarcticus TaxID=2987751 RepID=A0ABY6P5E0_9NOCA|nr:hypothetical protein [Rhodococcus antarcticus]UZJ26881.1 hypothetical protein RHODO2019_17960 [Rhodococcus antarcticus]